MVEAVVGLLTFFLGWICLRHALRWRSKGYPRTAIPVDKPGEPEVKPRMIVPLALGTLLMLIGGALMAMALLEVL